MKHTNEEAQYISENLKYEGFDVKVSASGDYFRLEISGNPILADSADNDLYDTESSIAAFNEMLDNITAPNHWVGVVKAAIQRGFNFKSTDLDQIFIDAEKYIIDNVPFEDRSHSIVPEFWGSYRGGYHSHLEWYDEDNELCTYQDGQIISNYYKDRTYYRLTDGKLAKAEWYESDDDDVYVYLDTVVTTKGEVVTLIA